MEVPSALHRSGKQSYIVGKEEPERCSWPICKYYTTFKLAQTKIKGHMTTVSPLNIYSQCIQAQTAISVQW